MAASTAPATGGGVAPEHAAFEALVAALLSPDNATRSAGEARFAEAKAASPDACVRGLLAVLTTSNALDARGLCAVLLRKVWGARDPKKTRELSAKRARARRCVEPATPAPMPAPDACL